MTAQERISALDDRFVSLLHIPVQSFRIDPAGKHLEGAEDKFRRVGLDDVDLFVTGPQLYCAAHRD